MSLQPSLSCMRSAWRHPPPAQLIPRRWPQRSSGAAQAFLHTSPLRLRPRQVLGKIEPKRIGIDTGGLQTSVWRPILFATGLSAAAYIGAALYTNADTDEWSKRLGSGSWWRRGFDQPSNDEMQRAKTLELAKKMQSTLDHLPESLRWLPDSIAVPITRIYISLSESYLVTPPSQRTCLSIIAVNGLVFLAWKMPRLQNTMRHWWMHWPVGRNHRVVTLATAVFSHQSLPHYAFNSIALYSFGSAAYTYLSRDDAEGLPSSTSTPHFLAFFLAAGLFSSLSSHLATTLIRVPALLRDLATPGRVSSIASLAAHQSVLPSLGASGAIYATLTLTALAYPDARISLIFLPMVPIPIGWGMVGMVGVDLLGVIRGWKMFDHVAHLSGAIFGVAYWAYGRELWVWIRRKYGAKELGVDV